MIYLSYNDPPSGIYSGQVIGVCNFLNKKLNANIRLVALISLRGFGANRRKIKSEFPGAIVLPLFPGVGNWRMNVFLLFFRFLFLGRQSVIARGPFAASLALSLKRSNRVNRVCFDARGAYDAEFNEYKVAGDSEINKQISSIEKNALLNADFRIAVSDKLVDYWKEKFGYKGSAHVVIPCTVSEESFSHRLSEKEFQEQRASRGFAADDVVFVYSGSSAGWQSLELADDFLCDQMKINPKAKALFLTDKLPDNMSVNKKYTGRVKTEWLDKDKMANTLQCCDYGLLIRESSVTNKVSSPVKFAEYLAAGLQVVISENIGDYSAFVKQHGCGFVMVPPMDVKNSLSSSARVASRDIARKYFSKDSHIENYKRALDGLC